MGEINNHIYQTHLSEGGKGVGGGGGGRSQECVSPKISGPLAIHGVQSCHFTFHGKANVIFRQELT